MWIKRNNVIVNTDNVCAIQQQGDKVVFRFSGTASASTIDRASLSAELVLKGVSEDENEKIFITNASSYACFCNRRKCSMCR